MQTAVPWPKAKPVRPPEFPKPMTQFSEFSGTNNMAHASYWCELLARESQP
jgi:hypothetical protein